MPLAAAAVTVAVLLQGGTSQAQTVSSQPSLKDLVAQATQLSNEVDSLGQQYDGLKIQLGHANSEVKIANQAAARAEAAMAGSQKAVAQLAAMGYMNGGMDPTLQMLTSGNPNLFLSQASTVQQLDDEAGMRLSTLQREQLAAERAQTTAKEEIATANRLQSQINGKVKTIHAKLGILNSSAMSQAMAVFDKTGNYPNIVLPEATNVGTTALRAALTQRGKPYVWGAACRIRTTAPAWSCGRSSRRASPCRTTRGTSGTQACTSPGPTLSRVTWCSSSPTSATSASTSATA